MKISEMNLKQLELLEQVLMTGVLNPTFEELIKELQEKKKEKQEK